MAPKKVILCGYQWIGCRGLDILLERGYEPVVFSQEAPFYVNDLVGYCRTRGIPCSTDKINRKSIAGDAAFLLSLYYRYIVPDDVLQSVGGRAVNLHPSLLPDYRGCSSLTWAMTNGEEKAGYSYHYMTSGFDEGNILLQREIVLAPYDTQQSVYQRVMVEASAELGSVIDMIERREPGVPQPRGAGRYFKRGAPFGGEIDETWSDEQVERFIRAMIHPPLRCAMYRGVEVRSFAEYLAVKHERPAK